MPGYTISQDPCKDEDRGIGSGAKILLPNVMEHVPLPLWQWFFFFFAHGEFLIKLV